MFHVLKNGICISGAFNAVMTNDPVTAYHWMRNRFKNNQYFTYYKHPEWASAYELLRRDGRIRVKMGEPIESAIFKVENDGTLTPVEVNDETER